MKRSKGFSLVELLVVIAIIGVLSALTIMRLAAPQYDVELKGAGNIVQTYATKARDLAGSAQQSGTINDVTTVNGYGLKFNLSPSTYRNLTLFEDKIDRVTPANQNKWDSGDRAIATVPIGPDNAKNVVIKKIVNNNVDDTTVGDRSFVFSYTETPSKQKIYFDGISSSTDISLFLMHLVSNKKIQITIKIATGDIIIGEIGAGPIVYGCTNPGASNYASSATVDNGSCGSIVWIAGAAGTALDGKWVYATNLVNASGYDVAYAWGVWNSDCIAPYCQAGLDSSYPSDDVITGSNSVDFTVWPNSFPARQECKVKTGGRMPNMRELKAIYSGRVNYGNNFFENRTYSEYWSANEISAGSARFFSFYANYEDVSYKDGAAYIRCIKD